MCALPAATVFWNAPATAAVSAVLPGVDGGVVVSGGVVAALPGAVPLDAVGELLADSEVPLPAAEPLGMQAAVARPAAVTTAPAAIPVARRMLPSSCGVPGRVPGIQEVFPPRAQDLTRVTAVTPAREAHRP
ncbi:MAG TPA: hypothetical protein VFX16_19570 [Pseudonocardiaceae bacterium]|nr:hypothetical protein [Pseudonocardiaceae bacterium]